MVSVYVILWGVMAVLYLALPCVLSAERRQRWWLRLTLWQWRVEHLVTVSDTEIFVRGGSRRTTTARSEVSLSQEEEEKIRRDFIQQTMEPYSMFLKPNMIVNDTDHDTDDTDQEVPSSEENNNDDMDMDEANDETVKELDKGQTDDEEEKDLEAGNTMTENLDNHHQLVVVNVGDDEDEDVEGTIQGLPLPGESHHSTKYPIDTEENNNSSSIEKKTENDNGRQVANSCAICLSSFEADEVLCWSSNPKCQHVFHQTCLQSWLAAMARKQFLKRLKTGDIPPPPKASSSSSKEEEQRAYWAQQVTDFSMPCPCCRQTFLITERDREEADKEENENDNATEGADLEMGNNNTATSEEQPQDDPSANGGDGPLPTVPGPAPLVVGTA